MTNRTRIWRDTIPSIPARPVTLRVTAVAERVLRQGHPWVYAASILRQRHEGPPGAFAVIYDQRQRFLAVGLYDPDSPIRVRVLQRYTPTPITRVWFEQRLAAAVDARKTLARDPQTTAYRLVHGENDGLPGLVIDRYADTAVIKLYTAAWVPHIPDVLEAFRRVVPMSRMVLRLSRAIQQRPAVLHGLTDGLVLDGPPLRAPIMIQEYGLRFEVDPIHGQKTGWFLDQRENRAMVSQLSGGCSVLDVCAYTGGFSVAAARGGARAVTSVDISRQALDAAQRNMALNRRIRAVAAARHEVLVGDAVDVLERLKRRGTRFDLVVIDPPSFAKSEREVRGALAAYARLTRAGLSVLATSGTLVVSSCSSHVKADEFFSAVHHTAARAGWVLREVARTGHPLDHPIRFSEGAYLKCLVAVAQRRPRRTPHVREQTNSVARPARVRVSSSRSGQDAR
ncbi:MAG: class I SAM-dependent methyltransferase [Candidatus Omnitrophica bacterium]|nr:class I SAM-dependent methyltransferase [Candidatus Omnitrophota bacterium]